MRFYQAAFGRVPDQAGLDNAQDYVRAFTPTAQTYQNLANQFVTSQEFINRFGAGTSVDAGYVQALYSTILGRQATAAEIDGYVSGTAGYTTRGGVLYAISQSQEAISISDNAVNGFLNNAAQGTAVYTGTLYTAQNGQPNQPGSNGQNFVFTTGIDALAGGAGNDTFTGDAATITAADQVDGGAGTDTVNLVGVAAANAIPSLVNVERLVFTNPTDANARDLSGITGLQEVVVAGAQTGTSITTAAGVKTTLGATGTIAAATVATAATATAETVGLNGGTFTTLTVNGAAVKNLTLDASANSTVTTLAGSAGATGNANSTLTITGASKLTVTNELDTDFTTVNASANTGGVSLKIGANTATVTGGSGNDRFDFQGNLTTADTVNGGAGNDTVAITGGDFSAAANGTLKALNALTSIETVEFDTAATTVSGTTLTNAGITKLLFNTTGADVVDVAGARTYAVGASNTGNLTLNEKAGVSTANIALEGSSTTKAVVADLIVNLNADDVTATPTLTSTVNVASSGTSGVAANEVATLKAVAGSTFNITGSQDLTVAAVDARATIDASAFTGKLAITGSAGADTVKLGSGADTVTVGAAGSTYTATDTISNFTKADTLALTGVTFAAATDLVKYDATNANSFEQALVSAETAAGGTGKAAYFNFGGNTYVVADIDNAVSATSTGSTDLVVKITGVQTLTAEAGIGIHGA